MFGNSVGSGFGMVAYVSIAYIALMFALAPIVPESVGIYFFWGFWLIGLTQLVYVVPLYLRWKDKQPARAKGLVIGASTVALLNASCWGAFEALFRR